MFITNLTLKNYRNIGEARLEPAPRMNVFYGDNGQGKTNLLEGISLFALGRSFRGAKDRELVNCAHPELGAELEISVAFEDRNDAAGNSQYKRDTKLSIRYTPEGRRVCRKNGVCVRSLSEFVGNFRVVLFASPQLGIVRDSAVCRRHFLDTAISQLKPIYMERLSKLNRLLVQRNKLLRQLAETPSPSLRATLDPWTRQLACESAYVSTARYRYIARLMPDAADVVRDISGGREILTMSYPEPLDVETLYNKLMQNTDREISAGTTLYGAHREDLVLTLGGREARVFASQGQQRSIALALKLAEGKLSETVTGDMPVYLLDDVLSELDDSRRRYVLENIAGRQVILTVCDGNVTGDRLVYVANGEVLVQS